jgi:hypothetical protein
VVAVTVRILVTGNRRFGDYDLALTALSAVRWEFGPHFTVVYGDAPGADRLLAEMAEERGLGTEAHPAEWAAPCQPDCRPGHRRTRRDGTNYCPAAGNYRNQAMVDLGADLVLAFLVEPRISPCTGTRDCIRRAEAAGIPVRRFEQKAAIQ